MGYHRGTYEIPLGYRNPRKKAGIPLYFASPIGDRASYDASQAYALRILPGSPDNHGCRLAGLSVNRELFPRPSGVTGKYCPQYAKTGGLVSASFFCLSLNSPLRAHLEAAWSSFLDGPFSIHSGRRSLSLLFGQPEDLKMSGMRCHSTAFHSFSEFIPPSQGEGDRAKLDSGGWEKRLVDY
jgi:hypothetical protein